jgi:hypothetical protein
MIGGKESGQTSGVRQTGADQTGRCMLHDPSGNPGFVLQQLQSMVANKPLDLDGRNAPAIRVS